MQTLFSKCLKDSNLESLFFSESALTFPPHSVPSSASLILFLESIPFSPFLNLLLPVEISVICHLLHEASNSLLQISLPPSPFAPHLSYTVDRVLSLRKPVMWLSHIQPKYGSVGPLLFPKCRRKICPIF